MAFALEKDDNVPRIAHGIGHVIGDRITT